MKLLLLLTTLAYGPDPLQRIDVYAPKNVHHAPVIFMVHGGGWRIGDKSNRGFVENKVEHWVPRGYVVISVNYRMLPGATPNEQAKDVAAALAFAQKNAATWGGDPNRFVLMGHSAGAHLIALVASRSTSKYRGAVILDSAALDVPAIMRGRHLPLYDQAFGSDPNAWRAVSPYHALESRRPPMLVVCSSQRMMSCAQANAFAARARMFHTDARVLEEDLSHAEINRTLGTKSEYTAAVDAFLTRVSSGAP